VTDDEAYARNFAEKTWGASKDKEKAMFEKAEEEEKKKLEVRGWGSWKIGFRDFGVSAFGRRSWWKVYGVELRVYSVGRRGEREAGRRFGYWKCGLRVLEEGARV
jgi:hypothetical protein